MRLSALQRAAGVLFSTDRSLADRSLATAEDPSRRARALRIDAERCFRLAQGSASLELADELEALGRVFETEADELAA